MKPIQHLNKIILKIQQHDHEGFWLVLIALIGITLGYSSNLLRSIWESITLLTIMISYVLWCLRLLYQYIQPDQPKN